MKFAGCQSCPVAMTNAVATDTHSLSNKGTDVICAKRTRLSYAPGQDKKLRAKTAPSKFGCSDQQIGGISVVERDLYSLARGMRCNAIEDRQKAITAKPVVFFAGLKLTQWRSNPVKINDTVLTSPRHLSPAYFPQMQQQIEGEKLRSSVRRDGLLRARI